MGLLGLLGLTAASCVSIVGADEEVVSVAEKLCECDEIRFLGPKTTCTLELENRLEQGREETRTAWMRKAEAQRCFTSCKNALECYRTSPTCSNAGCDSDDECCLGTSCKGTGASKQCL